MSPSPVDHEPSRSMAGVVNFASLPPVGRDGVRERLLNGLQATLSGGGLTLLLRGERGTGKTHFARSLAGEAERRGFRIAEGRAYRAEAGVPYALFTDTFLPLLREETPESLSVLSRGCARDLEYLFPGLIPPGERKAPLDAEGPGEVRARVLWTLAELLREISRRTPLLIVMEDLQWADASSLEVLHFLARQLKGDPAFFLLTREKAPGGEAPALEELERSLLAQGVGERLGLPALTREETGILIKRAFGVEEEAAADFIDHLHRWTEGNPFFLEETLKSLTASGRLYRKGGAWLGWEIREMELPRTVREAVLSRLEGLSPGATGLAELAATLGTRAPFSLLGALSPLSEGELLEALELLVARDILTEGLEGEGVVYDFRQVLIRETVLSKLGLARARVLHQRVARGLEEHLGARAPEHAGALAFHYHQAGMEGASPAAVTYLTLAGRDALRRFGDAEAARYLTTALNLLDGGGSRGETGRIPGEDRLGILRDLARALTRMGQYDEALRLWEEAVEAAEDEGSLNEAAEFRRRMGVIKGTQGDPAGALVEFDAVLALPPGAVSGETVARTRLRRGVALEEMGRLPEARAELEEALALAQELGDPALLAQAHRALVLLHLWTGHPDRVREHAARATKLARSSGAKTVEFWTYVGLAAMEGLLGNTQSMAELVGRSEQLAEELRSPLLRLRGAELAIEHAAATGEWATGIALGEQAIALARDLSQKTILPRVLVWTSLIYLGRGEVELARPLIQEAWAVSGAGGMRPANIHGAIPAYIGMGYLALAERDYDEAIRIGREGLRIADQVGYGLWALHRLVPMVAEAYLWKGDLEGAREMGERLRAASEPIGHRLGMAWAQTCDALVTWLGGDPARGAELMAEAARALEEIPMVPDATRLRRQLAGRLAKMGDREGALRELNRVHDTFLRLGAEAELEKTRGMFRELDARPPRRAPEGEGELSLREMEVARLVEARKSNKAIAKAMGISPRTVSTHLSNIYQKLGIGSRGELADHLRTGGLSGE